VIPERYLTPMPGGEDEVEVDHWFKARGERHAVVYRLHHGEPIFYVREERHLKPLPPGWVSEWPDDP